MPPGGGGGQFLVGALLAAATGAAQFETVCERLRRERVDWEWLAALAGHHLVTPALWPALVAGGLTGALGEDLCRYLEAVHGLNARRNLLLHGQAVEAAAALNAAGIEPVFLKGAAYLFGGLYADPATRFLGDIDLLVDEDRLRAAAGALCRIGYEPFGVGSARVHDAVKLVHKSRPGMLELHQWPVPFALEDLIAPRELIERAWRLADLGTARARMPCPTDLVVHNACHAMLQHRFHRLAELPLRDAHDLVLIAGRFRDAIDWPEVERRLARGPGGTGVWAFYATAANEVFPHARLPCGAPPSAARMALWRWRRRAGRPPPPSLHRALHLLEFAEDIAWRLRHVPSERRRLLGLLLAPHRYPNHARRFVQVAVGGHPTPFPGRRRTRGGARYGGMAG